MKYRILEWLFERYALEMGFSKTQNRELANLVHFYSHPCGCQQEIKHLHEKDCPLGER